MSSDRTAAAPRAPGKPGMEKLLEQYGCGPIQFTGTGDALYERHLMFDNVVDPAAVGPRERYEAVARSVRDVLSQRWLRTEQTYERENPKRVYYLSMEFLIGRSLANNIMNLLLDPVAKRVVDDKGLDWLALLEQEPDAGLGNGGLGRLAACFLDSMATMQLPAMGYGLRYEYGIFRQTIEDGWQHEQPDNWLRRPDPWEVARPQEQVEVKLGCSFEVRGGSLGAVAGRPSSLLGLPFDRPVVGYGGKTINTLRLWAAAAPDVFDFQAFSAGEFVSALAERLTAESLTRVLYPDDSTSMGQGLRFVQEYFLVACSLADLVRRFRRQQRRLERAPRQGRHPAQRHPPQPGRPRADADPARRGAASAGTRPGTSPGGRSPTPTTRSCPRRWRSGRCAWFELLLPRHLEIILEINRRLARRGADPLPGRRGPRRAREPRRGGRRAQDPDGQPRHRRLAQHQRRRRHPFRPAAHGDGQGPGRDVPRALQQQDQRRDAAALAAAGQPGARRLHHRGDRRRLDHRPRRAGEAQAARRRQRLSRRRPQGQARGQVAVRGLAQVDVRRDASIRTRSSTARSSASTSTSGSC